VRCRGNFLVTFCQFSGDFAAISGGGGRLGGGVDRRAAAGRLRSTAAGVVDGAAIAASEKLEGVIVDVELMHLLELALEVVNRTPIEGDRAAALQTGQVVAIGLGGAAVERFAAGLGAHLQAPVELEGVEGAVDGREAEGLLALAQRDKDLLGRERLVLSVEQSQDAIVTAGALGFHGGRSRNGSNEKTEANRAEANRGESGTKNAAAWTEYGNVVESEAHGRLSTQTQHCERRSRNLEAAA